MINISETAQRKISDILISENKENTHLRIYVQGGGCSGFQYGFSLDDQIASDDFEIPIGNLKVVVDSVSMQYLQGATVNYTEDLMNSRFAIDNPNTTGSCGCGSSFYV
jgi:iron-sulfur cluster insertion protein